MTRFLPASSLLAAFFGFACSGTATPVICAAYNDTNCDGVPDDLGQAVLDENGKWAMIDLDNDGIGDGPAVDTNRDGVPDARILDLDGDGRGDALDTNNDTLAEVISTGYPGGGGTTTGDVTTTAGTTTADPTSTGGDSTTTDASTTDASTTEESTTDASTTDESTTGESTTSIFGDDPINMGGGCLDDAGTNPNLNGKTSDQYKKQKVSRNNVPYMFITNGWGENSWGGHTISFATGWTAFRVDDYTFKGGTQNGVPAGYPAIFCGQYSTDKVDGCGLDSPVAISSITSLPTGLKWSHPSGAGTYNVSYDVWLSTGGTNLNSYFMVWFKDPGGAQPAGGKTQAGVTVDGVPGTWDIWEGSVNGHPIVSYVRPENSPSQELFYDMKDFFDHAASNGINLNGTHILGIAVGTEVWSGPPVQGLFFEDFCVDIQK